MGELSPLVDLELQAEANERYVAALGTAAAIGQVLGNKQSLRQFRRSVDPQRRSGGTDSAGMAELRSRIHAVMDLAGGKKRRA